MVVTRALPAWLASAVFILVVLAPAAGAADAPAKNFDLALSGGTVAAAQRVIRVDKGDLVRLRVSSDTAGELHVHAYRVQVAVSPGAGAEISFKAFASGRFPIAWHGAAATAQAGGHHAPPLATLDVRPK